MKAYIDVIRRASAEVINITGFITLTIVRERMWRYNEVGAL